ncbi:hypothetical protein ACFOYU_03170 [Microvirga sp. GCM10011540]|uniref:hypothetical protein n=1 Tax=Microvirga sp. GCM10011540 TaxID=3317338 RepID=UPI00361CB557
MLIGDTVAHEHFEETGLGGVHAQLSGSHIGKREIICGLVRSGLCLRGIGSSLRRNCSCLCFGQRLLKSENFSRRRPRILQSGVECLFGRPDLVESRHQGRTRDACMNQSGIDGSGIVQRLIDDQVRDDARIRVDHCTGRGLPLCGRRAAGLAVIVVVVDDAGSEDDLIIALVPPERIGDALEDIVGCAPLVAVCRQIVEAAIDGAQAIRRKRMADGGNGRSIAFVAGRQHIALIVDANLVEWGAGGMSLRNFDLLQDEF